MTTGGLKRWNTLAIIVAMVCFVVSIYLALRFLAPIGHRFEAQLLALAQPGNGLVAALAMSGFYLWLTAKTLVLPTGLLAMGVFVEWHFSEAEREPKNYVTAALIQVTFISLAFGAGLLTMRLIPLPKFSLFEYSEASGPLKYLWMIGIAGFYIIIYDVLLYWSHRAHHHIPFLWKFHAVHHSPSDLNALHNLIHPVELIVRYFTIIIPMSMIIQIEPVQIYIILAFLGVQNQLNHMNVPIHFGLLGKLFVDNRHHFIHHSQEPRHFDRNYASIFSVTDRLFGTYHPSDGGSLPATGLDVAGRPLKLRDYLVARVT